MNKYEKADSENTKDQLPIAGPTCIKCGGDAVIQPIKYKSPNYYCLHCNGKNF